MEYSFEANSSNLPVRFKGRIKGLFRENHFNPCRIVSENCFIAKKTQMIGVSLSKHVTNWTATL